MVLVRKLNEEDPGLESCLVDPHNVGAFFETPTIPTCFFPRHRRRRRARYLAHTGRSGSSYIYFYMTTLVSTVVQLSMLPSQSSIKRKAHDDNPLLNAAKKAKLEVSFWRVIICIIQVLKQV